MSSIDDPWLQAKIDAAIAPYAGRLSDESLAWMREQIAESILSDPEALKLMRGARPRTVDASGVVGDEGAGAGRDDDAKTG